MKYIQPVKIPKIKALGLNNLEGVENPLQKNLNIKYISSSKDKENISLIFAVTAKNLKSGKAKIHIVEEEAGKPEPVASGTVQIRANGTTTVTHTFSASTLENLTNSYFEGEFEFNATIVCDGLSAETGEFRLKFDNKKESNKCGIIVPKLKLTETEKKKFISTVLCEAQLGNDKLNEIAWVYYNRVNLYGLDGKKGLNASNPYRKKLVDYKLCSYYYKIDNESSTYGNIKYGDFTIKGYLATQDFKQKIEPKFKKMEKFIRENIFNDKPITCFKDWIGQGYWGDLDMNPDDPANTIHDPKWYMARQYYWLQIQKKVSAKYVHIMKTGTGTTFIFDEIKIEIFFKKNPSMLPEAKNVRRFRTSEGFLDFD